MADSDNDPSPSAFVRCPNMYGSGPSTGVAPRRSDPAWQVQAARISAGIERELRGTVARGTVVAVHVTAVNLRIGRTSVTIAATAAGGLPDGVLVADSFRPRALGLLPGMLVRRDGNALIVGRDALLGGRDALRIELAGATVWSPVVSPITRRPARLGERARVVLDETSAGGCCGFGMPAGEAFKWDRPASRGDFGGVARPAIRGLWLALIQGDVPAARDAGSNLIGLGAGLTPAGDDVLVGLTAVLTALGHRAARPLAASWSLAARDRTTLVAETFHRHAARAEYAERFHQLLGGLLLGPFDAIAPAVRRAAQFGATSGLDSLLGVSIGLDVAARAETAETMRGPA